MAADQAQRTEQPTPRRKQKAREEGQVPSSREFTAAVQFAAAVGLLLIYGNSVAQGLRVTMRGLLREAFRSSISVEQLQTVVFSLALEPLSFVGNLAGVLLAIGFLMQLLQTGFAFTPKRLQPDLNRLNPGPKLSQLPGDNLSQTLKAVVLMPLAGVVFWLLLEAELDGLLRLPKMSLPAGADVVGGVLGDLLLRASVVLLAIGGFDFYRQRRKTSKKLLMTKQEVKQEQKDLEGHPQVKARLRKLQRELARRRMMSQVPEASVVVTNPAHYAVALKYLPESMAAPVVVAKGLDFLALRIRKVAEEHGVPIVENPALAQALYKSAEVGSEISPHLYRAVAEILAYIHRLSRGAS